MTVALATRDDLDTLRRLILSPATGTIETRAALMRCLARCVRPDLVPVLCGDAEGAPAPPPAPVRDPILGPGQG